MGKLPEHFGEFTESLIAEAADVEGYLSPNEMRFLALLAAYPTATGEVVEIGSFKGRSTIILARSAALANAGKINAVDPMIAPSETDPDLRGADSSLPEFRKNLTEHGVVDRVEFHKAYSFDLAKTWEKPIRLLWIDGDHTYEGTKKDFEGFAPHLADGAIVALHDVLHEFEGGVRVFIENVLLSRNFAACGFVGSIAWAQYLRDGEAAARFRGRKLALVRKLSRLVPFVALGNELRGFKKKKYKLLRSRVPHGAVKPEKWIALVDDRANRE